MSIAVAEYIDVSAAYELERNKPIPSKNHAAIQMLLGFFLLQKYLTKYTILSEVKIEMPEKPDLIPDLSIYPKLEIDFKHDQTAMNEMPLVAIEIMSPTQSNDDIITKIERYFNAGVHSCWMVIPTLEAIVVYSSLDQYQFFNSTQILKDSVMEIEIDLAQVFK